jgi:REP element-mobilizing transposase RayT
MSRRPRSPIQLSLPTPLTWGGRRAGAGRKPAGRRAGAPHTSRRPHQARHPVHVTLRARRALPSFRSEAVFPFIRRALAAASKRTFRLVHFSVQTDHLHLVIEADDQPALARGMQGLAVRAARAVNRACARRGSVWSERYHAHALRTPREVRAGLVYVLLNFRKHLRAAPGVDPRSSGAWFDGWRRPPGPPAETPPVLAPRTWLARFGWRRAGGCIDPTDSPAAARPQRSGHASLKRQRK